MVETAQILKTLNLLKLLYLLVVWLNFAIDQIVLYIVLFDEHLKQCIS